MPKASREYITLQTSTAPADNLRTNWALTDELQRLASGKQIGWKARSLYTVEDIEDEALDPDEILGASGGSFQSRS